MRGILTAKNTLWLVPIVGFDQNESSSLEESSDETELPIYFCPQSLEPIETHKQESNEDQNSRIIVDQDALKEVPGPGV